MADDPRIVSRPERNAATSFRDNGGGDPVEAEAFNARPNDLELVTPEPALRNSTLAERAARAKKADAKQVKDGDAEDKQVAKAESKRARK